MSGKVSRATPKIAFYTSASTSFFVQPNSTTNPIEIPRNIPFSLEENTPILVDEVSGVCLEKSRNINAYFRQGNLWVKVKLKRFIKERGIKEVLIRSQTSSSHNPRISVNLEEAYIWAGRLKKGDSFELVKKKFPKRISRIEWEESYIRRSI